MIHLTQLIQIHWISWFNLILLFCIDGFNWINWFSLFAWTDSIESITWISLIWINWFNWISWSIDVSDLSEFIRIQNKKSVYKHSNMWEKWTKLINLVESNQPIRLNQFNIISSINFMIKLNLINTFSLFFLANSFHSSLLNFLNETLKSCFFYPSFECKQTL